ncbi:hypothetical protein O5623_17445 [Escherichia coli]|nr:hypothetical protein [Escherichia coli]
MKPSCEVPAADGSVIFTQKAARTGNTITVTGTGEAKNWTLCLRSIAKCKWSAWWFAG